MNAEHHYLGGGNACRGCGSMLAARLATDTIYSITRDALVFGSSCGGGGMLPLAGEIGNEPAAMCGIELAMEYREHPEKRLALIVGEGRVFESGFQSLSGLFSRGHKITVIVLDNEGYASSGTHQTATTPLGARSPIHPEGKSTPQKNAALMMIFNNAKYVATASPAFPQDLKNKVAMAMQYQPSLVQVFCPCITTWGLEPSDTIALSRMAASNGMFPLWEYKDRVFRRTVKPRQREHVGDFLKLQRRYTGTNDEMIARIDEEAEAVSWMVERMEAAFSG